MPSLLAALLWYLALAVCALLALPVALRLGRRLPDGGYALARPLGLLLVGYLTWLLGMLGILNSTAPTVVVLAALLAVGLWSGWGRDAAAFLRSRRALVLWTEAVFLAGFFLAALARASSPAINGQEKFMDMALYHAFLRAEQLPAEDPWLAGYGVPYYYFGYFLWSLVAKATAVPPAVGYNLALAATFAMLASGVFGLAYSLLAAQLRRDQAARLLPGAALIASLGVVATGVMGNLQAAVDALASLGVGSPAAWRAFGVKEVSARGAPLIYQGSEWFRAARVIPNIQPDGITEFPWFSLLLGDLHPHFVALPFELLVLALGYATFRNLLAERDLGGTDLAANALALGALIPLNTWDVGTFWVIYLLAVGAALLLAVRRGLAAPAALRFGLALLGATFGLAIVLYFPYFVGYQSQPLGLGIVEERTPLGSLVVLFGPFLVLVVGAVARGWLDGLAEPAVAPILRRWLWIVLLAATVLLLLALLRDPTLGVLLALVLGTAPLLLAAWHEPERAPLTPFGTVLLLAAVGLLLGTELLFIRDTFGTRMNTVFKFYYHVWLLLGLLSPLLVVYLLGRGAGAAIRGLGASIVLAAGALALAGLLYPVGATWAKAGGFRGPLTLDGAAWMKDLMPGDAHAVQWLRERVPGRPVIVEAVGGDYTEYGRIAAFAGLPSPLNWPGHELQWRGPLAEFARRQDVVEAIYQRAAVGTVLSMLQGLHAEYVYVGRLEAEKYGSGVYSRFDGVLEPVYRQDDVTIYRVPQPPSGIGVGLAEVRP
ncbi:MAG: hypothetical protein IRZ14_08855 [Chloroflexi bacterium]|nr:hypothetical protein [Chloroflexota bacterium]